MSDDSCKATNRASDGRFELNEQRESRIPCSSCLFQCSDLFEKRTLCFPRCFLCSDWAQWGASVEGEQCLLLLSRWINRRESRIEISTRVANRSIDESCEAKQASDESRESSEQRSARGVAYFGPVLISSNEASLLAKQAQFKPMTIEARP